MKIVDVRLTRTPPHGMGQGDDLEAAVTVENTSTSLAFVAAKVRSWTYDAATRTLTLDFRDQADSKPPTPGPNIAFGVPQHTIPLDADLVEIPPRAKVELKDMRPVVLKRQRLLESGEFETVETDTSHVEHVVVRLPADTSRFARAESEDVEHARSRFRAWGKSIEHTFNTKLR